MRLAEKQGAVTVCRNGRNVAFLVSRDRMEAIVETLEIMANPKAMQAIRDYESGKVKMLPVSVLNGAFFHTKRTKGTKNLGLRP